MLSRIQKSDKEFAPCLLLGSQTKHHQKVLKEVLAPLEVKTISERIAAEEFARKRIGQNLTTRYSAIFVAGVPGEQGVILTAVFQWYKGILLHIATDRDGEVWRSYKNPTIEIGEENLARYIEGALLPQTDNSQITRTCTVTD